MTALTFGSSLFVSVAASNGRRRTLASTEGIFGEKETSGCCQCGSLSAKAAGNPFSFGLFTVVVWSLVCGKP